MKTRPAHWPSEHEMQQETFSQPPFPHKKRLVRYTPQEDGTYLEELLTYLITRTRTPEEEAKTVPFEIVEREEGRRFKAVEKNEWNPETGVEVVTPDFELICLNVID